MYSSERKKLSDRFVCHRFEFFRVRRPVASDARNARGIGQKAERNVEDDSGASVALLLRLSSDVLGRSPRHSHCPMTTPSHVLVWHFRVGTNAIRIHPRARSDSTVNLCSLINVTIHWYHVSIHCDVNLTLPPGIIFKRNSRNLYAILPGK